MKKLVVSIRDNWYTDLQPTLTDHLTLEMFYWISRNFKHGKLMWKILWKTNHLIRKIRIIEIYLFRRQQLKYYDL